MEAFHIGVGNAEIKRTLLEILEKNRRGTRFLQPGTFEQLQGATLGVQK